MIKQRIDNRSITFRLDAPGVQRSLRLGSIKVIVEEREHLIRVYGHKSNLCERRYRIQFEHALREAFTKELLSDLLGKPVEEFHFKRFNPSLALTDGEAALRKPIGALA